MSNFIKNIVLIVFTINIYVPAKVVYYFYFMYLYSKLIHANQSYLYGII